MHYNKYMEFPVQYLQNVQNQKHKHKNHKRKKLILLQLQSKNRKITLKINSAEPL